MLFIIRLDFLKNRYFEGWWYIECKRLLQYLIWDSKTNVRYNSVFNTVTILIVNIKMEGK